SSNGLNRNGLPKGSSNKRKLKGGRMIRLARAHRLMFGLLPLLSSASPSQAQQNPRLPPVNYGNIVLTASNWPFLIAEQEELFQKEGIDFKRVIGGNTTATTQ